MTSSEFDELEGSLGSTHVIVFFSMVFGSGLARLRTLRKSDVFARILEWM
jgi:hypothetical protein